MKRKRICLIPLSLLIITICGFNINDMNNPISWETIFEKNKINGTFVLYDLSSNEYKYYNAERSDSLYTPASTFKILNSLIALETNAVTDANEIIKWDGSDRGWSEWNKDQNMRSAISVSCVWFYQELARRIGEEQMKKWLDTVEYGNTIMVGEIDNFWLEGNLKISAKGQIRFLKQLVNNELPFQHKNQDIVKEIMITDSTKNYVIHSKTGWGMQGKTEIGWFVGYVEKGNKKWIFAMNLDIIKMADSKLRKSITYDILRMEKIIE